MKTLFKNVLTVIVFSTLTLRVEATFPGFQIGSPEVVTNYCVTNVVLVDIGVYQNTTNGVVWAGLYYTGDLHSFSNKSQLDQFFRQKLFEVSQTATTNTFGGLNRDLPYKVYGFALRFDETIAREIRYFSASGQTLTLINSNGQYFVPDLSSINLDITSRVAYKVPQLNWGRFEAYDTNGIAFVVEDTGIEAASDTINVSQSYILLQKDIACSGTNGNYRMKLSIVSGNNNDFQVFDITGKAVSEQPIVISNLTFSANTVSMMVSGEIGRTLQLMSASAPNGPWLVVPATQSSINTNSFLQFSQPISTANVFFRVRSTNAIPYQ